MHILFPQILQCSIVFSILSQEIALKTNALSWATTTINLGAEFKISPRLTAGADIMYKGWSFLSDNRKMGGFLVQPEAKYWFCIPFYKHFMGLHAHYGQYNGGFSKYRYQGDLYGIGLSLGKVWKSTESAITKAGRMLSFSYFISYLNLINPVNLTHLHLFVLFPLKMVFEMAFRR